MIHISNLYCNGSNDTVQHRQTKPHRWCPKSNKSGKTKSNGMGSFSFSRVDKRLFPNRLNFLFDSMIFIVKFNLFTVLFWYANWQFKNKKKIQKRSAHAWILLFWSNIRTLNKNYAPKFKFKKKTMQKKITFLNSNQSFAK